MILYFFRTIKGSLSAVLSTLMLRSKYYLISSIISHDVSKIACLIIDLLFTIMVFTPLLYCRNKLSPLKDIKSKYLSEIALYVQFPQLINIICTLKMFDYKNLALGTSILSLSPFVNYVKDKYTKRFDYNYCDLTNLNSPLIDGSNNIVVKYSKVTIRKEDALPLMYLLSIMFIYLDSDKLNEGQGDTVNTLFFSSIAVLSTAVSVHNYKRYIQNTDEEVFNYLSFFNYLVIAIVTYSFFAAFSDTSFNNDFVTNDHYLGLFLLSLINLPQIFLSSYSIKKLPAVSDYALISGVTTNTFGLFLEKGLDLTQYGPYVLTSILLNLTSCIGLMISNKYKNKEDFIDVLSKLLQNKISIISIKEKISEEWKNNHESYNEFIIRHKLNKVNSILETNYNEVLLILLSKVLGINFYVKGDDNSLQFFIKNTDNHGHSLINIDILLQNIDCNLFNNKIVQVSQNTLTLLDLNVELAAESLQEFE